MMTRLQPGEPHWEAYFAVVYAATVAIVETGPLGPMGRIAASAALAAMVPWYLLAGRPLLRPAWHLFAGRRDVRLSDVPRHRELAPLRGPVYLAVLVALFAVVQSQSTSAWILAFALTPMCLQVSAAWGGMAFVVLLNGVAALLVALRTTHPSPVDALNLLGIVAFSVGSAYLFRRWMMRVVDQSEERAELIEQLESTRSELAAMHREAGMLAERHRLAGEIHDTLAQGFTSIVTLVQAGMAGLAPDNPAQGHLALALKTARENLAEARTLVAALRPAGLDEGGLGDAVRRAAESAGAEGGIDARTEVCGPRRQLPTGTEVVLLRVCQEALANVRKHAVATRVDVLLRYGEHAVELTVADDGRGFDRAAVTGGYGLRGMRDRVHQAGGDLEVTTGPGAGTVVRAEIPV